MIYLVRYDRKAGTLLGDLEAFNDEDASDASEARLSAEIEAGANNENIEIVTLRANSLEDLLITHSRYFKTTNELRERLRQR